MPFSDLALSDALLQAVQDCGYDEPTAIQAAAIPLVLMGKDLIGVAQTGTGKTASFVLPMIDILAEGRARARMPRSLILEPTRELAAQVAENIEQYSRNHKLSMALLIGGVAFGDQDRALEKGADILIATPGRLIDQHERGKLLLSGVDILVIDEADRMLDMGFIPDVEKICSLLGPNRQTLLFSATMPPPIKKLADRFMTDPRLIEVARPATANRNITQMIVPTTTRDKRRLLQHFLGQDDVTSAIVFCNRKTTVRDLASSLKRQRFNTGEIHGDMDQPDRIRELERFRNGEVEVLVASDVAARGIDIDDVSHVFNFDVPWHPDDYVHRIGRTGRAGRQGVAITFVIPDDEEAITRIEELTGEKVERLDNPLQKGASDSSGDRARDEADKEQKARPARKPAERKSAEEKPRERKPAVRQADDKASDRSSDRRAADDRPEGRRSADQFARNGQNATGRGSRSGRQRVDADDVIGPGFGTQDVPAFLLVSLTGK